MKCMKCMKSKKIQLTQLNSSKCGEWCRPNVVLFGEDLPKNEVSKMYTLIKRKLKYIIVIGTTLELS